MRVAIIGAGAAGLAAARHVSGDGHKCEILEMGKQLGGTWVYTDDIRKDENGFPVYSAMYKGLTANLPKEVMGYPDFPVPEHMNSYLSQAEILEFLNLYADNFNIRPFIKFNRMVTDVSPHANNSWQVTYIAKPMKKKIIEIYDAVMICVGNYNEPLMPVLPGQEKFKGKISHSYDYRSPEPFTNERVLVIGAGPSGLDIALHISAVAKYVVLSHHRKEAVNTKYPSNVIKKPDVISIKDEENVEFSDGTCCGFDTIFYCTGYKYSFPFLNPTCGVIIEDNHIQPLYKHMIHIEKPTLCFIGIPFNVCAFHLFDLQARFYCKYLNGSMPLPSTGMMRMDTERDMQNRWAKGYTKPQAHLMGPDQKSYYNDLATTAKITSIAPVIVDVRNESVKRLYDDLLNFRKDKYKIIDDKSFIRVC